MNAKIVIHMSNKLNLSLNKRLVE